MALTLAFACGEDAADDDPSGMVDSGTDATEATDDPTDATDDPTDATDDSTDATDDSTDEPVAPPELCEGTGQIVRPFIADEGGLRWGEIAGDFTVTHLDGSTWNLAENFTGCDSYLFVNYFTGVGDQIFDSPLRDLVERTADNAHVFFTSFQRGELDRRARLEPLAEDLDAIIAFLFPEDQRAAVRARYHVVLDRLTEIPGSVGEMTSDYIDYIPRSQVNLGDRNGDGNDDFFAAPAPSMFGIDREQRWDAGGSPAQFVGGEAAFVMASYLPDFYNHKARMADRIELEEATAVVLLDEPVTERIFVRSVELPSGDELSAFDTLEFDVRVNCRERTPFSCSEWDRIGRIQLCADEACEQRTEVVRWITPYWRRGERRWIIDASSLLPLLDGGTTWFRVAMGPGWERKTTRDAYVSIRLRTQDVARPAVVVPAFGGGDFDFTYNDREPLRFDVPADATRVELVVMVSGHGQDGTTNCAEWCDHAHSFAINGQALAEVRSRTGIGSIRGCAEYARFGVSPGQYGNWAPQRAFWCPGLPVDHQRIDMTDSVVPGQENELEYAAGYYAPGSFQSVEPGPGTGGGRIDLSTYVVVYRE
jgi:hypothetical protein